MATTKISALALIAAANITAADIVPMTDADAGTPTTYKMTMAQMRTSLLQASVGAGWGATDYLGLGTGAAPGSGMIRVAQGALAGASSPLIYSTATWNNAGTTFTHFLVQITDTASAAASLLMDYQVGGTSQWKVTKGGAGTLHGGLTIDAGGLTVTAGSTAVQALSATTINGTSLVLAGAITGVTSITFSTGVSSTTALATPGALSATQASYFASTASGATLMGYGTTGDVTLKNRAGTDVIVVTSNTVNTTMAGALAIAGALSGVTTLTATTVTATNLGGTLTTVAQPNVTSVGTLTSLAISGALSMTAGSITLANGQFYKATRTSGGIVINLLGIESGTDRTLLTATADWVVQNGSGVAMLTVTTAGVGTLPGGLTVSAGTAAVQALTATTYTGTDLISTSKSTNSQYIGITARNTSNGTGAYAQITLGNDATANGAGFVAFSSGFTTSGLLVQDAAYLYSNRVGGIAIVAEANATVRIGTNNVLAATFGVGGGLTLVAGITATTANLSGAMTLFATSSSNTHVLNRTSNAYAHGLQWQTNGTADWVIGYPLTGASDFQVFSYGTTSAVVTIARATGVVTFAAGIVGSSTLALSGTQTAGVVANISGDFTATGAVQRGYQIAGTQRYAANNDVISGFFAGQTITNGGAYTGLTGYGLYISNPAGTGTVATVTALYIESITRGTTNRAIVVAGGQSDFQAVTCTTLGGTGALSGFTSGAFSGTLSTTAAFAVASGQKIYVDGVAASGDTYIYESVANTLLLNAGTSSGSILLNAGGVTAITVANAEVDFSVLLVSVASSTASAAIRIQSGTAPTSPINGDMWYDGTNVKFRVGGTTKTFTLT